MEAARRLSRILTGTALIGLLAVSALVAPANAAESYSEDAVKAAYLYRFVGYVDWPERGSVNAPFVIDVMGSPGVARELRRLLPGHLIHNRIAEVREIASIRDRGDANMLYIGAGHGDLLRTLSPAEGVPAMLLITDEEGGLSHGGAINFLMIDHNVRFEVSVTAAERWGLKISSELLGVAVRVQGAHLQTRSVQCPRQYFSNTSMTACASALGDSA